MAFQDQRCHRTGQPLSVSCSIGEHLFAVMKGAHLDSGGDRWSQWRLVTSIRDGVISHLTLPAAAQDLTGQITIAGTMPLR